MKQFDAITRAIIEAAKSIYPSWKNFEVKDDFPEYHESLVWDSVTALKDMHIQGLDIRSTNDVFFSVRCHPGVAHNLDGEIPPHAD